MTAHVCCEVSGNVLLFAQSAGLGAPHLRPRFLLVSARPLPARAAAQEALPTVEIGAATVVSADRVEERVDRSASAVTVIPSAQIEKRAATGLIEVLRGTPGLDLYETGGPGTQTSVFLRGATPGQTLVLVDGVRIGDPSSTDGSVDFGGLVATDIERIEVLRGPQSALYGSDAMGGVIRHPHAQGRGEAHGPRCWWKAAPTERRIRARAFREARIARGTPSPIDALHVDGLPRYGYRITRPLTIGDGVTPLPPLPSDDPTNKGGASARLGYRVSEDLAVEAALLRL